MASCYSKRSYTQPTLVALSGLLIFAVGPLAIRPVHADCGNYLPRQVSPQMQAMIEDAEIKNLGNGSDTARMDAAKHLGEMKTRRAVACLIKALDDPQPYVRGWAAWALEQIGDPSAIDPLIGALVKYERPTGPLAYKQLKCLPDFVAALKKLTGQDFGFDSARWLEWNRRRKELTNHGPTGPRKSLEPQTASQNLKQENGDHSRK